MERRRGIRRAGDAGGCDGHGRGRGGRGRDGHGRDRYGCGRDAAAAGGDRGLVDSQADGRRLVPDGGRTFDQRFETIVDQVSEPIFLKDREGRYRYVNEACAGLFGATREAVVGLTDADLFDAETAAQLRREDERVVATGESTTAERTRAYHDEERVWRTTKHPYRPDDRIEGVIGVSRDVTERVRAEDERERNERALEALQRLASDRTLAFEERLDRALELGRDRLDLPIGFLNRIADGTQEVVAVAGDTATLEPGSTVPLEEAYCRRTVDQEGVLAVAHASAEGWDGDPAYERYGLECYLGGTIRVGDETYGTLCFADTERRDREFTDAEETFVELLVEWVSYELERREREEELERFEAIVRSVDDGVYEVDADGRFTFVNEAMAALTGDDRAELVGEHLSVVKDDDETAAALDALLAGNATERTVESPVRRKRGRPVTCEDNMTRLDDAEGDVRGVVGVVRDVTEQREREAMLSELVASSRSFMGSRDREEVAAMVAQAVKNVLGFELNVVRLFDRETERLVPAGTTDAVSERLADPPTYDIGEGGPGEAFVDGEAVVVDDATAIDDEYDREVVRSAIHLPMGVHGTISIGAESSDAFSDVDRQAIRLLATSGAAAANRAKREREVRDARERVDALVDRINGLIEDTVEVLVRAGTREEIEGGVTEQLVATDPYAFAWIARPDFADETLVPTAWEGDLGGDGDVAHLGAVLEDHVVARDGANGDDESPSDDEAETSAGDGAESTAGTSVDTAAPGSAKSSTGSAESSAENAGPSAGNTERRAGNTERSARNAGPVDPTARAFADEEIHVLNDLDGAPDGSVHAAAAAAGLGSMVAVPLTYTDTSYGVLTVYADEPDVFADRERVVLAALGQAVANAVNAVESGRILSANRVVELEFTVQDPDLRFGRLSTATDATLELAGSAYQSDGRLRQYVTATGTDAETVAAALADDDAVRDASVITDDGEEVLFEATVEDSLVEVLADYGAVTRSVTAADGTARYTIELPYEAEAREVFDLVERGYEETDLVGYHEHERPVETRQAFRETVFDRFTERQETAVRTAYLGGFFQWPRDVDGDALADSMDISRPTYHQHLRAAQRKVFEELFDGYG